eukprot:TRINITY_DN11_c0_g1_i1.p1 TRINITY_DN11_c0_g1~~TRINITY_DN11_c0_g1_i1.p1  ORF type:complete len:406 (-),score=127.22 TRINITY_DN11_c0_g1_i1:117-1334(-)
MNQKFVILAVVASLCLGFALAAPNMNGNFAAVIQQQTEVDGEIIEKNTASLFVDVEQGQSLFVSEDEKEWTFEESDIEFDFEEVEEEEEEEEENDDEEFVKPTRRNSTETNSRTRPSRSGPIRPSRHNNTRSFPTRSFPTRPWPSRHNGSRSGKTGHHSRTRPTHTRRSNTRSRTQTSDAPSTTTDAIEFVDAPSRTNGTRSGRSTRPSRPSRSNTRSRTRSATSTDTDSTSSSRNGTRSGRPTRYTRPTRPFPSRTNRTEIRTRTGRPSHNETRSHRPSRTNTRTRSHRQTRTTPATSIASVGLSVFQSGQECSFAPIPSGNTHINPFWWIEESEEVGTCDSNGILYSASIEEVTYEACIENERPIYMVETDESFVIRTTFSEFENVSSEDLEEQFALPASCQA